MLRQMVEISLMKSAGMEKSAASLKVLSKMLDIVKRNPGRYSQFADRLKPLSNDLNSIASFAKNAEPSKKEYIGFNYVKDEMNRHFGTSYTPSARDTAVKGFNSPVIRAYNVSDRLSDEHHWVNIGPPTKHVAIDVLANPSLYKRTYHTLEANSKPIAQIEGYESVAKGKYLKDREVGVFTQENSNIANNYAKEAHPLKDTNNAQDRYHNLKQTANQSQYVRDYNDVTQSLHNRNAANMYKVNMPPLQMNSQVLDNLDHNTVFKGFKIRGGSGSIHMENDSTNWVTSIPNVASGYAHKEDGHIPGMFNLRTKSPQLLNTLNAQGLLVYNS